MWGSNKDRGDDGASARPNKASNKVDTLVGRQTEVAGDVRFTGGLHVDGRVKGKVMADADDNAVLSVSESGHIEGDVRVPHITLNGSVEGDVHASQHIALSAKAQVDGNVYYRLIEMTSGAMVNGQMVYDGEGEDKIAAAIPHRDAAGSADDSPSGGIGADVGKTSV